MGKLRDLGWELTALGDWRICRENGEEEGRLQVSCSPLGPVSGPGQSVSICVLCTCVCHGAGLGMPGPASPPQSSPVGPQCGARQQLPSCSSRSLCPSPCPRGQGDPDPHGRGHHMCAHVPLDSQIYSQHPLGCRHSNTYLET